ncbi:hypothetical protein [Candidatus Contubernalis alkaliaceticus]|uniref:hypothetical protein n=1 Tax=Candidatus Contubernalis alkaliaceticus TaxID=338645 RepID=UPI001F4BF88D|nr:hypothetical protein [Candidatus Contubernalis alkalaceticus]UNC92835.1 hypothetical protein HUE98_12450 [Candidatus Contubernalis alkalaceticus]
MLFFSPFRFVFMLFVFLLLFSTGCLNYYSAPSLTLDYLDAVQAVSVIKPFKFFNNTAVEMEIKEPEEVEVVMETLKSASVKGVYKPGDSGLPDMGFPDYYLDLKLGELEVRCFYWNDRHILLPNSLGTEQAEERYLLELDRDIF